MKEEKILLNLSKDNLKKLDVLSYINNQEKNKIAEKALKEYLGRKEKLISKFINYYKEKEYSDKINLSKEKEFLNKINLSKENAKDLEISIEKIKELIDKFSFSNKHRFEIKSGVTNSRVKIEFYFNKFGNKTKILEASPVVHYKKQNETLILYVRVIRTLDYESFVNGLTWANGKKKRKNKFSIANDNILILDYNYWTIEISK